MTTKLYSLNVVGVITWITESTNVLGFVGALIAVLAGLMLLAIRWKEFVASVPVQWFLGKLKKKVD